MANFTQANRPMKVKTPLGGDVFLLAGFTGHEAISQLFHYELDLLVENTKKGPGPVPKQIQMDSLLGQSITVELELPKGKRFFNGICSRISQGGMDENFTVYRMEVVPKVWLLTRKARSRIFQPPESSVPQILTKLLKDFLIDDKIQDKGKFYPRDYCVQYRETDFNFIARLMEEEGIFFFFTHDDGKHTMVLTNTPQGHPAVPGSAKILYEPIFGGNRPDDRIHEWSKMQELRSGKYTLWDYCFEKPDSHLDTQADIQASVAVGEATHKLATGGNSALEIYDYPGEYAQRFDGIDKGGGEKPADVQKIFEDNKRTVGIRMQEEAAAGLVIHGSGNCRNLVAGCKFTLANHVDANGDYALTSVNHAAREPGYLDEKENFHYSCSFTCIPFALPFRPPRITPKPVVAGTHTAVVVGPAGEEIFTDKYGRVKVQFHWDREGKKDAGSSCWVRVGTPWAGKAWGMISIPRIGHEVIVDFLEGDPDQPLIIGSVYNADNMPPYTLPANKTQSGIKSRSSLKGGTGNFNEFRFEDKKGSEMVTLHAEKDQEIGVEHDEAHWVGHDRKKNIDHDETTHVKHDRTETVDNNETITIHGQRTETVDKNETITIHQNRTETVDQNETVTVSQNRTHTVSMNEVLTVALMRAHTVGINETITVGAAQQITVGATRSLSVGASQSVSIGTSLTENVGTTYDETVGKDYNVKVGKNWMQQVGENNEQNIGKALAITAGERIVFKTGDAMIEMKKDGSINIKGKGITIIDAGETNVKADKNITMKGQKILQN
jgi:type VI secretion system secreted protein VgrG